MISALAVAKGMIEQASGRLSGRLSFGLGEGGFGRPFCFGEGLRRECCGLSLSAIASKAQSREANQHHHPGRGLGNGARRRETDGQVRDNVSLAHLVGGAIEEGL